MDATTLRRTVVEEYEFGHQEAQKAIVQLRSEGVLEEHPDFSNQYRIVD